MKLMKSVLITIALSLLFINISVANDNNPVIKVEKNKIHLSLKDVSEQTTVQVLDYKGETLIEEKVAISKQFESVLNMEFFAHGSYRLVIKSATSETIKRISINKLGVRIVETPTAIARPILSSEKRGSMHLSFYNPSSSELRMLVFDARGQRVHQQSIQGEQIIDQDINLKQLRRGRYTVVINHKGGAYTQQVSLR